MDNSVSLWGSTLRSTIRRCKKAHKERPEKHLEKNNARKVWKGLNNTGHGKDLARLVVTPGDQNWANQLSQFFFLTGLTLFSTNLFTHVLLLQPPLYTSATQTQPHPLQFDYCPGIRVDDAIMFLLNRGLSHQESQGSTVRVMFLDFFCAFNTNQPS